MDLDEDKVLSALSDPRWDWRTLEGLERSTGLPQTTITSILNRLADRIEAASSTRGLIFRVKDRRQIPTSLVWRNSSASCLLVEGVVSVCRFCDSLRSVDVT
jgi:hypothetical protein